MLPSGVKQLLYCPEKHILAYAYKNRFFDISPGHNFFSSILLGGIYIYIYILYQDIVYY